MSHSGGSPRHRIRIGEIVLLSLVLSVGVAGLEYLARVVFAGTGDGSGPGARDVLLLFPVAAVAVGLGLRLTSRADRHSPAPAAALNKAAAVSLVFTVLLIPWAFAQPAIERTLGGTATRAGLDAVTTAPGLTGRILHVLTDALIGQAVALPVLFAALLWLGRRQAMRASRTPHLALERVGLVSSRSRTAQLTAAATFVACASFASPAGASTAAAAPLPAPATTGNPCDTAPHDTFHISAINVDLTLNRYGVHDPNSFMYVLDENIDAVRAEERTRTVSDGLRGDDQGADPIQPLVLRAHEGDCVTVNLTNRTTFGVQAEDTAGGLVHTAPQNISWNVDGLPGLTAADVSSTVGTNTDKTAAPGETVSYTVYLDPALGEGAHVFHSTGDYRQTQAHGLFGTIISEPKGSRWLDPHTLQPLDSGWNAVITMPSGSSQPNFREFSLIFSEIGDEAYRQILEKPGATCHTSIPGAGGAQVEVETDAGCEVPFVDPFTSAYRPCSKAINYRSECFFSRELVQMERGLTPDEAEDYSSYTNGDMATPRPELYVGDPYKLRLTNAGSEMGHVFHEHGGAIRWLRNPRADDPDIDGGLEKHPPVTKDSIRLDSQTIEPGESYNLETECGAGGCQQVAGEFLYHCHIAAHYDAGMLGFIRVFDTKQADLATMPTRTAKPAAVSSAGLIGKVIEGKTVVARSHLTDPSTQTALEDLVENQLPPQGVRSSPQDATVWNWTWGGTEDNPVALGEPQDTEVWANYTAPHPGQRPEIMFDPVNGRYAWPLLQPHLGMRPPFSPNGHSGAPWLGPTTTSTRPDGLCPADAPVRHYNITAITVPIQETSGGVDADGNQIPPQVDNNGEIYVLNEDKAAVLDGTKPPNPLAIRSSAGDCVAVTLTNELTHTGDDESPNVNVFHKLNIHIHFVQFDTQASDGVITGFEYEQAMQPDTGVAGETTLTASAPAGSTHLQVASTAGLRPGISVEVGQGLPDTEVVTEITAINGNTLTLNKPLQNAHASGERTGVEFAQYRWYSDAQNGTVFFHDHVDALHSWGHGLFGAHIIEPPNSTFHDPKTGAPIRSGPIADIYTNGSAGFGEHGAFREFVLWQHEGIRGSGTSQGCEQSSFNLRAAPLIDRDPNAANTATPAGAKVPDGAGHYNLGAESGQQAILCTEIGAANDPYAFSSVAHGDPPTPLLRAYVGDPVVIRQVGLDERVGDLRITGHRFAEEVFNPNGVLTDAGTAGISEKMDYVINGGAGGPRHLPGDYLYYSGRSLEMESGAWGIFRVHDTLQPDLKPLPDRQSPPHGQGFPQLTFTGKAPPAAPNGPGDKACPDNAPVRSYDVAIFDGITFDKGQPGESDAADGGSWAVMYALSRDEADIKAGRKPVVPLVIRANAGECLRVTLHNDLPTDNFTWTWGSGTTRAGFNVGNVIYDPQQSYGAAIGFNPDTTVAPGHTRLYSYYVDRELGTNLVLNMGNESTWRAGGYGAVIAEPRGSTYRDPRTGDELLSGISADIAPGDGQPFREYVSIFSDREPTMGHNIMPYPIVFPDTYLDYSQQSLTQQEGDITLEPPLWQQKSNGVIGSDPATPVFTAKAGDPVRWRFVHAAGDAVTSFQIAGHSFPLDHGLTGSEVIEARTIAPGETFDAYLVGGAGGATRATGDYEYNLGREPIVASGAWGIFRVVPPSDTSIRSLTG